MDQTNKRQRAAKSDMYHREFDVDHNSKRPRPTCLILARKQEHERAPTNCPIAASTDHSGDAGLVHTTTAFNESVQYTAWNLQKI